MIQEKESDSKGKNLLSQYKKVASEKPAGKGSVKYIFIAVFITGILFNIGVFLIAIFGYGLQFPRLYFGEGDSSRFWTLILAVFPTLIGLCGILGMTVLRGSRIFSRVLTAGLVPAIILGAFSTMVLFMIPPICSATESTGNYMKLDSGIDELNRVTRQFFPSEIPERASETTYHYFKYSAIFSDTAEVEASWILPDGEYEEAKRQALALNCFKDGGEAAPESEMPERGEREGTAMAGEKASRTVAAMIHPERVKVIFEYDDEDNRLRYHAEMDASR